MRAADGDDEGERDGVADEVGDGAADEHRGAAHRQAAEPVDDAVAEVLGDARRGDAGAEQHVHDDHAGQQVLHVRTALGADDESAEHRVQHDEEDDGLDGAEEEHLRHADGARQVAPGDEGDVRQRPWRRG